MIAALPMLETPLHNTPKPEAEGYVVHDFLGRGGAGAVWRATQQGTLREVALKFLAPWHHDGLAVARFAREAEIAASLEHENIVRAFGSGGGAGSQWLAMELVEGPSLDRWIRDHQPLQRDRILLFRKICAAVRHAHQRGVIHRDLKPANVLVAPGGIPKVVDFGFACWPEGPSLEVTLTRQGEVFGSLAWMPPEQAGGRWVEVDALSDIFALGAILYSLMAEGPPLDAGLPPAALLAAAQSGERRNLLEVRPGTPRDIGAIVNKCLAPEKCRRYQSAAELEDDVARWLAGEPVRARAAAPWYWLGKKARRHWMGVTAGLVGCLAAGGMGWGYLQGQRSLAEQKRQALEREAAQSVRTLHQAQELVTQLLVEMRSKLEESGHSAWMEEAGKRVAAFQWDIGGNGGAYDPRRFRARAAMVSGELLSRKGQWGGALKAWHEAINHLKGLIQENPAAPIFREEMGQARLGEEVALLKLGFHKEAVAAGQKAVAALTPAPGEAVLPATLSTMVEATCALSDAAVSAREKMAEALEVVTGIAALLPVVARPEDMNVDQAGWHARIGREMARLTAGVKGPAGADAIAVRAAACARQACRLTGEGELTARVLAEALATEADIAGMQGDRARAFDLLMEASGVLSAKKGRSLQASLSAEPLMEVAKAWERCAGSEERTGGITKAIAGNAEGIKLWAMIHRRNRSDSMSLLNAAQLHLRNARLWRQLNQPEQAISGAIAAASRFRSVTEGSAKGKMALYFDWADAALLLAELKAPPPGAGETWAGVATATLEVPRARRSILKPSEKQQFSGLEQRLQALASAAEGTPEAPPEGRAEAP